MADGTEGMKAPGGPEWLAGKASASKTSAGTKAVKAVMPKMSKVSKVVKMSEVVKATIGIEAKIKRRPTIKRPWITVVVVAAVVIWITVSRIAIVRIRIGIALLVRICSCRPVIVAGHICIRWRLAL